MATEAEQLKNDADRRARRDLANVSGMIALALNALNQYESSDQLDVRLTFVEEAKRNLQGALEAIEEGARMGDDKNDVNVENAETINVENPEKTGQAQPGAGGGGQTDPGGEGGATGTNESPDTGDDTGYSEPRDNDGDDSK